MPLSKILKYKHSSSKRKKKKKKQEKKNICRVRGPLFQDITMSFSQHPAVYADIVVLFATKGRQREDLG